MEFGSQSTFHMVQQSLENPDSAADYHLVYAIIQKDCRVLLSSWDLSQEDKDDIIQDTQISIYAGLVYYVEHFAHASPAQRNAYLRKVLLRRGSDQLTHQRRHKQAVSYDNEDFPQELCGVQDDLFQSVSHREQVHNALTQVCSLNFPEDEIIAFLATRCTVMTGKSSKPSQVAQQLSGMSLKAAAAATIHMIQQECPFPISGAVYAPLMDRLTPDTDPFGLTPKEISNANCKIIQQLRKQQNPFIGGISL